MLNTSDVKSLSKGGTTVSLEEISNSIDNKLSIDNLKAGNGIIIDKPANTEFVRVRNNITAGDNITLTHNPSGSIGISFNTDQPIYGLTLGTGQYSEMFVDGSYGINFIWNDQGKSITTLPVAYSGQDAIILTNRNLYRHVIAFRGYGDHIDMEAYIILISSNGTKIDSLTTFFSAFSEYANVDYPCTGRDRVNNETIITVYPNSNGGFSTSAGSSIGFPVLQQVEITDTVTTV